MQDQDVITKEFYGDAARVADFVNGYLFEGAQLVSPEDISELDSSMFGKMKWFGRWTTRQRYRDIVRRVLLGVRFAIIGVEEQGLVHFTMPVRALGYDFLSYDRQLKKIRKKHILLKDLRGSAQVLSGISPKDLLDPCVTIIVYYGEEPWNGPRCLKDMLKVEDFPEIFRKYINDYPLHIFEVNRFEHLEYFQTDLKLVFGFLQNRSSASKMKNFIRDNEAELCQVDDDAYDMMAVMSHSEELEQMKNRFRKGGKVDMCKALREWLDESKQEGVALGLEQGIEQGIERGLEQGITKGEARFASLTRCLLDGGRSEELLKATEDKDYRDKLYAEYHL